MVFIDWDNRILIDTTCWSSLGGWGVWEAKFAGYFSVDLFHLFDLLFKLLSSLRFRLKLLFEFGDVGLIGPLSRVTWLFTHMASRSQLLADDLVHFLFLSFFKLRISSGILFFILFDHSITPFSVLVLILSLISFVWFFHCSCLSSLEFIDLCACDSTSRLIETTQALSRYHTDLVFLKGCFLLGCVVFIQLLGKVLLAGFRCHTGGHNDTSALASMGNHGLAWDMGTWSTSFVALLLLQLF